MSKLSAIVLGGLFLVSALGGYLYSGLGTAPPPPVVPHPTVQRVAQATHRLETLFQPAPPAAGSHAEGTPAEGAHAPVKPRTLRVSEDDINVYLAGNAAVRALLKSRGVQAVQIVLIPPNSITLHAIFVMRGQPRIVLISGLLTPNPVQGVNFAATQAQAGHFPLPPGVVSSQAQAILRGFIVRSHHRLPLTVQSLQIEGKTLVITGLPVSPETPPAASPGHRLPARPASPPQTPRSEREPRAVSPPPQTTNTAAPPLPAARPR